MRIIRCKDERELAVCAAWRIAAQVTFKPDSVLGFATGTSPIGTYQELIAMVRAGLLSFAGVRSFNLDEYIGLAPTHDQSYRYFMNTQLFDHIDIDKGNTHVPNGMAHDYAAEGAQYDAQISAAGGIDLQLLGIGHNGHIGFNEPCDHFPAGTHAVDLTASTIEANARLFDSAHEVPRRAITMGIGTIFASKRIVLVASGAGKADIIRASFFGPITPQVPASILQLHPDVTVIADESAAARI